MMKEVWRFEEAAGGWFEGLAMPGGRGAMSCPPIIPIGPKGIGIIPGNGMHGMGVIIGIMGIMGIGRGSSGAGAFFAMFQFTEVS